MAPTKAHARAPHIALDHRGIAYVEGTRTKVLTIVQNKRAARCTPEQLQTAMPHLSLAQVYAALAYYHDHRAEVDRQIRHAHERAESILRAQPPGLTRAELRARLAEGAGSTC
ncbi:MAG TPA: DUF433 domain-containing protein [Chthonomonadaceae bacterium]|nr:DUF433 domain-containing protein [Chthonomonadaceae bacterium]